MAERMVTITLDREQAACLFDEVAGADAQEGAWSYLSRYERRMIRMCHEVREQLTEQGVVGVLAREDY